VSRGHGVTVRLNGIGKSVLKRGTSSNVANLSQKKKKNGGRCDAAISTMHERCKQSRLMSSTRCASSFNQTSLSICQKVKYGAGLLMPFLSSDKRAVSPIIC